MSILDIERSKESYYNNKLQSASNSIIKSTNYAINYFEKFCELHYKSSAEDIIAELNVHKDKETKVYEVLQLFVNYLATNVQPSSSRTIFHALKPYIAYRINLRIHNEDVKAELKFAKQGKPRRYGLTVEDLRKILDVLLNKLLDL